MGGMLESMRLRCPLSRQLGSFLPESGQDKFSLCLQHTEPLFPGICYVTAKKTDKFWIWSHSRTIHQTGCAKAGNGMCYIMFFLPSTVNRGYLISWLLIHFFFFNYKTFSEFLLSFPSALAWRIWGCNNIWKCYCALEDWQGFLKWMRKTEALCELKTPCIYSYLNFQLYG